MSGEETAPKRTVFILYIPGGGMLGMIPGAVLAQLEELTETPAAHLFQVVDGVSTGSILAAAMSTRSSPQSYLPRVTSQQSVDLFTRLGPLFFPEIKNRYPKMFVANFGNFLEDYMDPAKADAGLIEEIIKSCDELEAIAPAEDLATIEDLKKLATKRWLSRSNKMQALKLCSHLYEKHKPEESHDVYNHICHVGELVFLRNKTSKLGYIFRQSALAGIDILRKSWAKDYMFDASIPDKHFRYLYGNARLSESLRSTYISAYDLETNKRQTFFCRRSDFFSLDPNIPCVTSKNNHRMHDIVMASIANPFAFPPHVTEDGMICSDKAPIHTPLDSVLDVMKHKPADADVKLVILSTGKHISRDRKTTSLPEDYVRYGFLGNLLRGREVSDIENYNMDTLRKTLGDENIIEFIPRLSPRTYKETQDMPSRDILNASPQNVDRILRRAQNYVTEYNDEIRDLARMLITNLHLVGQVDDAKMNRIMHKINSDEPLQPLWEPQKPTPLTQLCKDVKKGFCNAAGWLFDVPQEQDNSKPVDKKRVDCISRHQGPY